MPRAATDLGTSLKIVCKSETRPDIARRTTIRLPTSWFSVSKRFSSSYLSSSGVEEGTMGGTNSPKGIEGSIENTKAAIDV